MGITSAVVVHTKHKAPRSRMTRQAGDGKSRLRCLRLLLRSELDGSMSALMSGSAFVSLPEADDSFIHVKSCLCAAGVFVCTE